MTFAPAFAPSVPVSRRLSSPSLSLSRLRFSPPVPHRSARAPLATLTPPPAHPRTSSVASRLATALRDVVDTSGTAGFAGTRRGVVQAAWVRHRGRTRYLRHVLGFPGSKLGRRLAPLSLVAVAECFAMAGWEGWMGEVPRFGAQPVGYVSAVVGLLLSFRTNASLARYYEARGAWQTIVSKSSDINRVSLEYMDPLAPATAIGSRPSETRTRQLTRYVALFGHCLSFHLEGADDDYIRPRIQHLVCGAELDIVLAACNRPSAVLQLVTNAAGVSTKMDTHIRVKLDGAISALMDASNVLEKLLRTPIPLSYTRHTSRACLLFCYYIPLTLYADMGLIGSATSGALITFLLLGIEDIGVTVEDPCRVLPLKQICDGVEQDVFQMLENSAQITASGREPL